MKRKTVLIIIACFGGSILFVWCMNFLAVGPNQQKNHFLRIFPPHFIGNSINHHFDGSDFYIAGGTIHSIYLGNGHDPTKIKVLGWYGMLDTTFQLQMPNSIFSHATSLHLSIDSPYIYLNNFSTGTIYRGTLTDPSRYMTPVFTTLISTSEFIPYSSKSFAIRTIHRKLKENILGRISLDTQAVHLRPKILESQGEGIFSSDGILRYNQQSNRLVYIYYYRNQFICMDSNFNILYKAQTLDTNTQAKIRVVEIPGQLENAIASPDYRVNRAAAISDQWIFINSDLRADNEEKNIFDKFSVIDIYSLKDGRYHFSFYLQKGKIHSMAIMDDKLAVIMESELIIFSLNMGEIKNR